MKVNNISVQLQDGLFYANRTELAFYFNTHASTVSRMITDSTRKLKQDNTELLCINDIERCKNLVNSAEMACRLSEITQTLNRSEQEKQSFKQTEKDHLSQIRTLQDQNEKLTSLNDNNKAQLSDNKLSSNKSNTEITNRLNSSEQEKETLKQTEKDHLKQIETLQNENRNLAALNDTKQAQLLDTKLSSTKSDTFIQYIKSKQTTQIMMLFIIITTFLVTFWEVIHLPKFVNLTWFEFIVYIPILLFALTMSVAVVWTAFNKSDKKLIDNLTLFVFVGVEVSSSCNFFGLNEVLQNGTILQQIITIFLSVGLPTLSIKIANHQANSQQTYSLEDTIKAFKEVIGPDLAKLNEFKSKLL